MTSTSPDPYPYEGPEELRAPILAALRRVVDPEMAMTVVDVGLIYGVTVTADSLYVKLTMTSVACPVTDLIIDEVETELDKVAPPASVHRCGPGMGAPLVRRAHEPPRQGLHGVVGRSTP